MTKLAKTVSANDWPDVLKTYEAAAYCRMCYRSFKKAVDAGMVRYAKVGGSSRFRRESLDEFLRGDTAKESVENK